MNDVHEQLDHLVVVYGPEKVKAAAQKLLVTSSRPIPAEYIPVLHPDKLMGTLNQLENALEFVHEAGAEREAAYQNKAEFMRQKTIGEANLKIAEAEAFMAAEGEGKDQHGFVNGKKIMLNNDANRDAYRRAFTANELRELSNICANIQALDVDYSRANDVWSAAVEAAHIVRAKAGLQAALLNFLAGRE